ncbi:MAG TPA: zf-HC2 domain-containing protein [Bacteroidales bacterium]|nr:zf-HC2 domain-containing protein [Bacteroidales bacterium]
MNCRTARNDLTEYLDGRLGNLRNQEVENHLAGCNDCREFSIRLSAVLRYIGDEKVTEFDPFMFTRIQAILKTRNTTRLPVFMRRVYQPLAIAFVALAVVFTGIELGSSYFYRQSLTEDYQTEFYYINEVHGGNIESIMQSE